MDAEVSLLASDECRYDTWPGFCLDYMWSETAGYTILSALLNKLYGLQTEFNYLFTTHPPHSFPFVLRT